MRLEELTTRDDIGFVLNSMGLNGIGAEIGVAFGENAEVILHKSNLLTLILVDNWDYVPGESPKGYADAIKDWNGCYNYCIEKLKRFGSRAYINRTTSKIASEQLEDCILDFCYIDANHMSPYIDNDLEYWYNKVKKGGIFGGHDYHIVKKDNYQCDVKTAVDNFFKEKDVKIHVTTDSDPSWYIIK
jgi:hypothetical protein